MCVAAENENFVEWRTGEAQFQAHSRFFTITAVRGGNATDEDEGDISIDDLNYFIGSCSQ